MQETEDGSIRSPMTDSEMGNKISKVLVIADLTTAAVDLISETVKTIHSDRL